MTAVVAMVALAGVSWVVRATFILLVPAHRLPRRLQAALAHLAPAALAALVATGVGASAEHGAPVGTCLVVVTLLAVALVVRRFHNLALGIAVAGAAALLIDLVLLA